MVTLPLPSTLTVARVIFETYFAQPIMLPWYVDVLYITLDTPSLELARVRFRDVEECDASALLSEALDDGRADARTAASDDDAFVSQGGVDGVRSHRSSCERGSNPRCARLRISPAIPSCHGGASCEVVTVFTRVPNAGAETRTISPDL